MLEQLGKSITALACGLVLAGLAIGSGVLLAACDVGNEATDDGAVVERVVDGDTVRVLVDGQPETVRLVGIDTPETVAPNRPVECFGPEASARLAEILPEGQPVTIETDPTQDERDRFDRLLGYVYPGDESESANEALVASGHARVFVFGGVPFDQADEFMRREAQARSESLGLWGACQAENAPPQEQAMTAAACDPNYGGCIAPPPPDLDCSDIDEPIEVRGADRHRLDGDGDGIACN